MSEAELGELLTAKATRDSQIATRPATPDAYKAELPSDFVVPQGIEFKLDANSPVLAQARAIMHDIDMGRISGQAAFSKLLALHASTLIADQQQWKAGTAAEIAKLGPTAQTRVTAIQTFLRGQLGDAHAAALNPMIVSANIVQALEALMAKFANQGSGSFSQSGRTAPEETGKIPGYETMSFMQRRQAQDALRAKQGRSGGGA